MNTDAETLPVALLGAGGINQLVARAVQAGEVPGVTITAVAGSDAGSASAAKLAGELGARAVAPEELAGSGVDWVVEAAGGAAVRQHVPGLWAAGINTIILSIGALVGEEVAAAYTRGRAGGGKSV